MNRALFWSKGYLDGAWKVELVQIYGMTIVQFVYTDEGWVCQYPEQLERAKKIGEIEQKLFKYKV